MNGTDHTRYGGPSAPRGLPPGAADGLGRTRECDTCGTDHHEDELETFGSGTRMYDLAAPDATGFPRELDLCPGCVDEYRARMGDAADFRRQLRG